MKTALLALAALLPIGQEPAEESPEEVLDQLALQVEAMEAFTIRYALFAGEEEPIQVRLAYEAPGRAALSMSTPEGTTTTWMVDGTWAMRIEGEDGVLFGEVDVPPLLEPFRDVRVAVHEAFGDDRPFEEEPLPILHVHAGERDREGNTSFSINFAFETRRAAFFCWNGPHRERHEEITLEPGHVVLRAPGENNVLKIARYQAAGFLELAYSEGRKGRVILRLEGFELDVDEDELRIPERPEGSEDLPEGMLAGFRALGSSAYARHAVYGVTRQLDGGDRTWNDDTRELLAGVFETLHRHTLPAHYEEWMRGQEEKIAEMGAWVARRLEDPQVDRGELEKKVALYKGRIEEVCGGAAGAYAENLKLPFEGVWSEAFLEVEREAARELFAETVTRPLLADFETEVEGLL